MPIFRKIVYLPMSLTSYTDTWLPVKILRHKERQEKQEKTTHCQETGETTEFDSDLATDIENIIKKSKNNHN